MNVIQALLDTEHWENFIFVMAHNENIKTFEAISNHLQMEDEHLKLLVATYQCGICCERKQA